MNLPIAHFGHWYVTFLYMGPVIVLVAALSIQSWRERRRLLTLRRPDPTVIWARAVQVAWQTADIRSEPARESRLRGRLNLISGLSGEPWQRSVPDSLKVLPATGTNRQS